MSKRITDHLRSNVVGYVAIFMFAMSGTAIALDGSNTVFSDDIVNGEVKTADIGTNEVTPPDIAANAVTEPDIATNAVTSTDILNATITNADLANDSVNVNKITSGAVRSPEIGDGGVESADVLDNDLGSIDIADSSLTGADIANESITGADISDGFRSAASAADNTVCNDDDENGEVCATTNITLSETARVLAVATGGWHTHGTSGQMSCLIDHDGIETIGVPESIGEVGANHPIGDDGTMAITGISAPIGAGTHAINVICTQTDADLDLSNANLSVVAVDE